jgi:cytosine/adenosine deaminase-related metal-dependent hydrolase
MPGLINSHTHIGDYILKEAGIGLPLRELVASPDGLKHRLLREAGPQELVRGMSEAEQEMIRCGTTTFLDFREQGVAGVSHFRRAISRIDGLAYGRPTGNGGLSSEVREVAGVADGIGLDSVGIYTDEELDAIRGNSMGKPIAVHVSEGQRIEGEMERALEILSASSVVHLTRATQEDLELLASKGGSAVVCPRSNLYMQAGVPPIDEVLNIGIPCGLGTDNCMFNCPDLFREMETTLSVMGQRKPGEVLKMATSGGAAAVGLSHKTGSIEKGKAGDLLLLEHDRVLRHSHDIQGSIVRRASPADVSLVLKGGAPVLDRRQR